MDIVGMSVKDGYSIFPLGISVIPEVKCYNDSNMYIRLNRPERFPEDIVKEVVDGKLLLVIGTYDVYKDIIVVPIIKIGNKIMDNDNYIVLDTKYESCIKFKNWNVLHEISDWVFI